MIQIHDKIVTQAHDKVLVEVHQGCGPVSIKNVSISNGGLILAHGTDPITLANVWNAQGSDKGGVYFVMLWPPGDDHSQQAVSKLVWDNSRCPHEVHQGKDAECIFRGKCDNATIIGVKFRGWMDNGHPWKQEVEIRHGHQWIFDDCWFLDSWPDIGQQKVAGQGYVTSQHVGTVTFRGCHFTKWTANKKVYSRQPGVVRVVFVDCVDPDGKKFSRTE